MVEAAPGSGNENGKEGDPNDQGKKDDTGFKAVTFNTQEELDAAFKDRVGRAEASAKDAALKVFTDAGANPEEALAKWQEWKAAEDAKKGPEAVEREKRQEAERELDKYRQKDLVAARRKEAAADPALKITDDISLPAELLFGDTKEDMVANGKAIIAFFTGAQVPRAPGYNPGQGHSGNDSVKSGDPIRNFFNTGSFE